MPLAKLGNLERQVAVTLRALAEDQHVPGQRVCAASAKTYARSCRMRACSQSSRPIRSMAAPYAKGAETSQSCQSTSAVTVRLTRLGPIAAARSAAPLDGARARVAPLGKRTWIIPKSTVWNGRYGVVSGAAPGSAPGEAAGEAPGRSRSDDLVVHGHDAAVMWDACVPGTRHLCEHIERNREPSVAGRGGADHRTAHRCPHVARASWRKNLHPAVRAVEQTQH